MTMWIVVIVAGIATYAIRFVLIGLFGTIEVPPIIERALRYIAPAVPGIIIIRKQRASG